MVDKKNTHIKPSFQVLSAPRATSYLPSAPTAPACTAGPARRGGTGTSATAQRQASLGQRVENVRKDDLHS